MNPSDIDRLAALPEMRRLHDVLCEAIPDLIKRTAFLKDVDADLDAARARERQLPDPTPSQVRRKTEPHGQS